MNSLASVSLCLPFLLKKTSGGWHFLKLGVWVRGRGGHGNPLQYSCLENPMNRGGWRTTVHSVAKSQTWLNDWAGRKQMSAVKRPYPHHKEYMIVLNSDQHLSSWYFPPESSSIFPLNLGFYPSLTWLIRKCFTWFQWLTLLFPSMSPVKYSF